MKKIKNKNKLPRLVITGSEGLIGRKLCQHFSGRFEVLKLDLALSHDLSDENFVREWFKKNKKLYGMIVCHAHNPAGPSANTKSKKNEPHNIKLDELRSYFEINSVSAFDVCRNFIRNNKKGTIITISSLYGTVAPRPDIYKNFVKPIGYSMSKAAVNIMTKYLATYYAPNFRLNTVIFGCVSNGQDPRFVSEYCKHTPLKRPMAVDEVTSVFDFLLDKGSNYVTGTEIFVDGGWTAW